MTECKYDFFISLIVWNECCQVTAQTSQCRGCVHLGFGQFLAVLFVQLVCMNHCFGCSNDGESEPKGENTGKVANVLDQVQSRRVDISSVQSGGQVNVDAVQMVVLRHGSTPLELAYDGQRVVLTVAVLHFTANTQALFGYDLVQGSVLFEFQLGKVEA